MGKGRGGVVLVQSIAALLPALIPDATVRARGRQRPKRGRGKPQSDMHVTVLSPARASNMGWKFHFLTAMTRTATCTITAQMKASRGSNTFIHFFLDWSYGCCVLPCINEQWYLFMLPSSVQASTLGRCVCESVRVRVSV